MKRLPLLIAGLILSTLSGCGALQVINENEAVAQSAFSVSTLAAIEQSTDRPGTAREILDAAVEARAWLDFSGVTLDELVAKARKRIAESDRELSKKAGLNLVLDLATVHIRKRVDAGELDPDEKHTVNQVLDWIVQAAQAYAT